MFISMAKDEPNVLCILGLEKKEEENGLLKQILKEKEEQARSAYRYTHFIHTQEKVVRDL